MWRWRSPILRDLARALAHPSASLYLSFDSASPLRSIHYASTTVRHSFSIHRLVPIATTKAGNSHSRDLLQSGRLQRLVVSAPCEVIYAGAY